MGILTRIWLGLTTGRIVRNERGEVVTWVVLAIGIVVITTGVLAIVGPGVLSAGQKLVNEMK
jgi:predicted anti-sigma-YlaC factor YlaD